MDATLIAAPPSTKNRERARDPEMHQTKKGNQWHFGMKAHIGTDAASGLVHSLTTTPANAADITQAHRLLHGAEREAFADSAYTGVEKRAELKDSTTRWYVAMKRGLRKALGDDEEGQDLEFCELLKAKIRARVEHPFHVLKNRFGHRKARYRGLAKNEAQLYSLFALGNLVLASRRLLPQHAQGVS